MLSIAYRMVGSFSEAEDLVQEAFVRLHEAGDVPLAVARAGCGGGCRAGGSSSANDDACAASS